MRERELRPPRVDVAHRSHVVHHGRMEISGDEAGGEALDLRRASLTAGDGRAGLGLDSDDLRAWPADGGVPRAEDLPYPADRAARTYGGDECVDGRLAHGVDDFRGRGAYVHLGVGRVVELLRQEGALRGGDFARLRDGSLHLLLGRREDDARSERLEKLPALEAHALRHREHAAVPLHRADQREADAGVAARRLHDRASRQQLPRARGFLDHGHADAVLHRPAGIRLLHLGPDGRARLGSDAADLDQRSVPDELEHALDNEKTRALADFLFRIGRHHQSSLSPCGGC